MLKRKGAAAVLHVTSRGRRGEGANLDAFLQQRSYISTYIYIRNEHTSNVLDGSVMEHGWVVATVHEHGHPSTSADHHSDTRLDSSLD